jgi:hypothetical protein
VDKELLFRPRLPEADVEIPGVGTVRVRGLTRAEVLSAQGRAKGAEAIERVMLSLGMVDPALTEAEAGRWQKASPAGELDPVTRKIQELSGMLDDSAKEAYKSLRDESGDGVRVHPSGEAGDDGRPAPGGDDG